MTCSIKVGKNATALVDDDVHEFISLFKWHQTSGGYGTHKRLKTMHRFIWTNTMGAIPAGMVIDHINHDRLDNRIDNLRCVDQQTNIWNRTSGNYVRRLGLVPDQPIRPYFRKVGGVGYIHYGNGVKVKCPDWNKVNA